MQLFNTGDRTHVQDFLIAKLMLLTKKRWRFEQSKMVVEMKEAVNSAGGTG